jgi:hypothetical protein
LKKKALLIRSAEEVSPIVPGVQRDVDNWKMYLSNNYSGVWSIENGEIEILTSPTLAKINSVVLSMKNLDYSLIIFIGHGFVRQDSLGINETFLVLNNNEDISERKLNPGNCKCLMIFDCCRTTLNEYDSLDESVLKPHFASFYKEKNYSDAFDKELLKCENGCVKLYAASFKQSANDAASFSQVLLRVTAELYDSNSPGITNIKDIFTKTTEYFKKNFPQQTPCYEGGRRLFHFPFLIKLQG